MRMAGYDRCVYRTAEGLKCAIGVLIDDDQFEPWLNGEPLVDIRVIEMLERSGLEIDLSSNDRPFLIALQEAHDESDPREDYWLNEVGAALSAIADEYYLPMPIPITDLEHDFALRRQRRLDFKIRWQSEGDRSKHSLAPAVECQTVCRRSEVSGAGR